MYSKQTKKQRILTTNPCSKFFHHNIYNLPTILNSTHVTTLQFLVINLLEVQLRTWHHEIPSKQEGMHHFLLNWQMNDFNYIYNIYDKDVFSATPFLTSQSQQKHNLNRIVNGMSNHNSYITHINVLIFPIKAPDLDPFGNPRLPQTEFNAIILNGFMRYTSMNYCYFLFTDLL